MQQGTSDKNILGLRALGGTGTEALEARTDVMFDYTKKIME